MEIERKWKMKSFPNDLVPDKIVQMRQIYLSCAPVVRIRESIVENEHTYILCFKGFGTLVRQEIEMPLEESVFRQLEQLAGKPAVTKELRLYSLPDGHTLEVSLVDSNLKTAFYYAEVEFDSVEQAEEFSPPQFLELGEEMTQDASFSMSEYWKATRLDTNFCSICGELLQVGYLQSNTPIFWAKSRKKQDGMFPLFELQEFYLNKERLGPMCAPCQACLSCKSIFVQKNVSYDEEIDE